MGNDVIPARVFVKLCQSYLFKIKKSMINSSAVSKHTACFLFLILSQSEKRDGHGHTRTLKSSFVFCVAGYVWGEGYHLFSVMSAAKGEDAASCQCFTHVEISTLKSSNQRPAFFSRSAYMSSKGNDHCNTQRLVSHFFQPSYWCKEDLKKILSL